MGRVSSTRKMVAPLTAISSAQRLHIANHLVVLDPRNSVSYGTFRCPHPGP